MMKKTITLLSILFLSACFSCTKQSDKTGQAEKQTIEVQMPEIQMIPLPASSFTMGSLSGDADETPIHTVILTQNILMGKYEVTNALAAAVFTWALKSGEIKADASTVTNVFGDPKELIDIDYPDCQLRVSDGIFSAAAGKENYPCMLITWYGALCFCNYLSMIENREPVYNLKDYSCDWEKNGYRLPTEAEWEFAARGGNSSRKFIYSGSNNPDEAAWFMDNAKDGTRPVGMKIPNELGFYDMSGNVWESCWDLYGYYIPGVIEEESFEKDLLPRARTEEEKQYFTRIYIRNSEGEYTLSDQLTNEECRKTWEILSAIGYTMGAQTDPRGIVYRNKRVLKGGDWGSVAFYLRPSYRGRVIAQVSSTGCGFRLVRLDTGNK